MILVDSSVWIDYFRGTVTPQSDRLDTLLSSELLFMGDLILAEVLQGFTSERDFNQAKILLTALPVIPLVGPEIAIQARCSTATGILIPLSNILVCMLQFGSIDENRGIVGIRINVWLFGERKRPCCCCLRPGVPRHKKHAVSI